MVVTAEWKTESNRRGVRTPSGRSQSAGAVRRWEVRRLRLWGFPSVVNSEEAVPSILWPTVSMRLVETRRGIQTEACLVDLCKFAKIARALTRGDQPASWILRACTRLPKTRMEMRMRAASRWERC